MQSTYGLDLGSSKTCIYKDGAGIVLVEPTLVAYRQDNRKISVVGFGDDAKHIQGKTTPDIKIVSPIKQGLVNDAELLRLTLKHFLSKVSELSPKSNYAVIAKNCGMTEQETLKLLEIASHSGFSMTHFVPSALCAGAGMGIDIAAPIGNIIVNIGYDTVEVAVISLNTIINGCTLDMGTNMLETKIKDFVLSNFNLNITNQTASNILIEVGSLFPNDMSSIEIQGVEQTSNMLRTDVVKSSDVYPIIEDFYNKIVMTISTVLNMCSPDIIEDIADAGMHFCGGGAKILGIEKYMLKKLKLKSKVDENPLFTVVLGLGKIISDKKLLKTIVKQN